MLRLSMEIPTCKLAEYSPLCDLHFVLAHKVLADEDYASFFLHRPLQQELILDNSTHEFGKPLPFSDLAEAAKRVRADIVIAPDIVNPGIDEEQHRRNYQWLVTTRKHLPIHYRVAFVVSGLTPEQRCEYVRHAMKHASMLCLSFHIPQRRAWWNEMREVCDVRPAWPNVHLLGVESLAELVEWYKVSEEYSSIQWSVDTSKALTLGFQHKAIDDVRGTLRGGPVKSKDILEVPSFTRDQDTYIQHNIGVLRRICETGEY